MMKSLFKPALAAGIAPIIAISALSAPAAAQVNGIAVHDRALVIASSQALQAGFQQIGTTFQAVNTQVQQLAEQRVALLRSLDTNGNGQLEESEVVETNPVVQQVGGIDQQIQAARAPIQMAQLYVVSQVGQQYGPAVQQVISDRSITLMLSPDTVVWSSPEMNVTEQIVTALNTRLPSVSITPPADWQPTQAAAGLLQEVQQVFELYRQAQAAQANAAPAPAAGEVPPR